MTMPVLLSVSVFNEGADCACLLAIPDAPLAFPIPAVGTELTLVHDDPTEDWIVTKIDHRWDHKGIKDTYMVVNVAITVRLVKRKK